MIISRGLNVLKFAYNNRQVKIGGTNLQYIRLSHDGWSYRTIPPVDKRWVFMAELFGGFVWWWIFWHLWHDYGHLIGEFPYPEPSKWTDEELGIPPDDFDD